MLGLEVYLIDGGDVEFGADSLLGLLVLLLLLEDVLRPGFER